MSKSSKKAIAATEQASELVRNLRGVVDKITNLPSAQVSKIVADATALQRTAAELSDPSKQIRETLNALIGEYSEPIRLARRAIEDATRPNEAVAKIIKTSLAQYSANTAALQVLSSTLPDLQQTYAALAGKKSDFQNFVKLLPQVRDRVGVESLKVANTAKSSIDEQFEEQKLRLEQAEQQRRLTTERVDLSLPASERPEGSVHPVSQVMDELAEIFADLGFSVAEGPEIEEQWFNFTALNMPEFHPARAMQDTFYARRIDGEPDSEAHVLRTHTSPVQIRTMTSQPPPLRLIAPGRVYRSDSDATHTPMFHQIEGLVIDRAITMGHLKWTLETFLKAFFERDDIVLRMRPSYFPFTEPSAEVDVGWSMEKGRRVVGGSEGWMEVLGSGMVHPKVIANCGLDPDEWQGFAFGTGVDRLAMLKYGMDDLRAFFDGDLRWLRHYGFRALDVPTLSGGVGA